MTVSGSCAPRARSTSPSQSLHDHAVASAADTAAGILAISCRVQAASPAAGPQAVRNFVQLCLEGYYDGCVFHRMIPDFLVQTGDPSGTGLGGESAFGAPFKDEFHSRLKFSRRWGLMQGQHPAGEAWSWHVRGSSMCAFKPLTAPLLAACSLQHGHTHGHPQRLQCRGLVIVISYLIMVGC